VPGNGPPPKRSSERRRRNKTDGSGRPYGETIEAVILDDHILQGDVVVPSPDPTWHNIARMLWDSILASGQSIYYEPSDWAVAYLTCESISRDLNPQVVGITEEGSVIKDTIPLKGASFSAYQKAFTALLLNEGDRRKLRLELTRQSQIDKAAMNAGEVHQAIVASREELFE